MSEWIGELRSALVREFVDGKPHVATLATVDRGGSPRARNDKVKANPQAEVVFWLHTLREQYRLHGSAKVGGTGHANGGADDPVRADLWRAMSDAARALFAWPRPGVRRADPAEAFPQAVPADAAVPPNFELIVVRPRRVEHLQLAVHPHRRRRWMLAGKWSAAAELNP